MVEASVGMVEEQSDHGAGACEEAIAGSFVHIAAAAKHTVVLAGRVAVPVVIAAPEEVVLVYTASPVARRSPLVAR